MRKRIMNNLLLKFISLLIAFILWITVTNIANPVVSKRIKVTPEVLNANLITSANKFYKIINLEPMYIDVRIRNLDYSRIDASDFRASVDLSRIYELTSTVPVQVEVLDHKEFIQSEPIVTPYAVTVNIEDMIQREYNVDVNISGDTAQGYSIGNITTEPETITLRGPASVLNRISSAQISVDMQGANSNVEGREKLQFYDAGGYALSTEAGEVTTSSDEIAYHISVLEGKTLGVKLNYSGSPAAGYRLTGIDSSVKNVSIYGENIRIDALEFIEIPPDRINIDGWKESRSVSVDLTPYLPEGVSISSDPNIKVSIQIQPEIRRTLSINFSDIHFTGQNNRFIYELNPAGIAVTVSGLGENVNNISATNLGARINVSNMARGLHAGSISFSPSTGVKIEGYSPFEITVREKEVPSPAASESSLTESSSSEVQASESKTAETTPMETLIPAQTSKGEGTSSSDSISGTESSSSKAHETSKTGAKESTTAESIKGGTKENSGAETTKAGSAAEISKTNIKSSTASESSKGSTNTSTEVQTTSGRNSSSAVETN